MKKLLLTFAMAMGLFALAPMAPAFAQDAAPAAAAPAPAAADAAPLPLRQQPKPQPRLLLHPFPTKVIPPG